MAAISKQEYLKRHYLSSNSDDKKKKRKRKTPKSTAKLATSVIVDDDITVNDVERRDVTRETNEFGGDGEDEAPAFFEVDGVTKISLDAFKKREEDLRTKWAPISENTEPGSASEEGNKASSDYVNRDVSPLRRSRQDTPDLSPHRGRVRDSPDQSPPRKRHGKSPPRSVRDSSPARGPKRGVTQADHSPPRSRRKRHDSDDSIPRQARDNSSPDQSPVRQGRLGRPDGSPGRRVRNDSPDLSPPRTKVNSDSDQSPPRKRVHNDSDQSPPRKGNRSPDRGSSRGRKAGLLSAADLQIENEKRKEKEAEMFSKMDPSVSGKGTETVYRDKMGRKKDLKMERLKRREEERKEIEENEKFMEWGRGVAQTQNTKDKVADDLHEMEKPLARYRDDRDLDNMLKAQERLDDPMLAYMKQQKVKQNVKEGKKEKPIYKGPDPPPNRFNIRPGYRWDGVDRSNGFEKKRFAMLANKMATQSQAYKWSSEDL